ncbi:MAG: sce7726 family protein, partial [Candidatus Schekmanbacteria bacterium]|nr:sce7726 family protein [Candidatus Schekmanbacteria bacterium]
MSDEAAVLGDADIRPALRSRLFDRHADLPDTVIVEELGVCRGRVRVDVAVVNGTLHGFEIKSDHDSLRRLGVQVGHYGKVLDRATPVVGERHLSQALDAVPAWWGVLCVRRAARDHRFETVRCESENPGRDPRSLVELLWLEDALALLQARDVAPLVMMSSPPFITMTWPATVVSATMGCVTPSTIRSSAAAGAEHPRNAGHSRAQRSSSGRARPVRRNEEKLSLMIAQKHDFQFAKPPTSCRPKVVYFHWRWRSRFYPLPRPRKQGEGMYRYGQGPRGLRSPGLRSRLHPTSGQHGSQGDLR